MHSIDIYVQNYFSLISTSHLTEFMYLLTTLFDFKMPFILVVLAIATLIYLVRNIGYSILFLFTVFSGAVSVYILKQIFNIARPLDGVVATFSSSFPSGHATMVTVFFIMLMYIFDPVVESTHYRAGHYLKSFWRVVFNTFSIAIVILVSLSRLYLGVHWVSDIVFGVVLGAVISYLSIIIFKKLKAIK